VYLFDLSLILNGFPIKKAKAAFETIKQIDDHQFDAYLETTKRYIVDYHLKHNAFYKKLAKGADATDWNSIPVMTKKDLQIPLQQRLSKGFTPKNCYINKTSGSSGDPFIFAKDKWCHALTWAENIDRFSWYGIDFNTSKQARFYGIPLDKKGYYKERFKDWLSNRYRFSVFDLSDRALETALHKFKKTRFDYINGYTSPMVQFAKFLKRRNLVLKTICPSIKVCLATSEMLFDTDKQLMETQFGVPVINEYGASELGLIAFENQQKAFQINSETLFVEILDAENQPVPYGQEGRVVITALYNKAHPFIRYDLGDIGVLSEKSSSKTPILKKLIGRTNDIAILPSGKKAAGLTFYYITKSIIEDDGKVKEFIIEQDALDYFIIKYVSDETLSASKKDIIRHEMKNYLEDGIHIHFERHEALERSKRGKLKQFKSNL
jgi:phenylacetate-CoA ligase